MPRTSFAANCPESCVIACPFGRRPKAGGLAPPPNQGCVDPELVEAARDDEVDEVLHRVRSVVEAGRGEEDHGTGIVQGGEAAEVDRREWRLARDEDELPPLLE